jgi:hypothetical protein
VLVDFAEPYADRVQTDEEFRKVLGVAVLVWNAALLPADERAEMIQEMVDEVPPEVRPEMRTLVEEMLQRKALHFADNKRAILDYQVTMTPTGPHVSVVSTFD